MVLTHKYYNGIVPKPTTFSDIDKEVLSQLKEFPEVISKSLERYRFREALGEFMNLARLGNKYLADEEPWKQINENPERVKTIMYVALQIAAGLAVLSEPFLPFTAAKLKSILRLSDTERSRSERENLISTSLNQLEVLKWNDVAEKEVLLPFGHQIAPSQLLFEKIEDEEIQHQIDKLEATKKTNELEKQEIVPQKATISFDDFTKLDIRVGTILSAEKLPKAKKLLVLKVDIGTEVRTIVSGIAESFSAEQVVGQRVTVLTNLAPRAIRGVESQGMILMTDAKDGSLAFVEPEKKEINNGAQIS
jgi:methionyl-tRNA synthetase